jgi:hypothetical protein
MAGLETRADVAAISTIAAESLRGYKRGPVARLQTLLGDALAGLRDRRDLVDWFDYCTRLSERAGATGASR